MGPAINLAILRVCAVIKGFVEGLVIPMECRQFGLSLDLDQTTDGFLAQLFDAVARCFVSFGQQ